MLHSGVCTASYVIKGDVVTVGGTIASIATIAVITAFLIAMAIKEIWIMTHGGDDYDDDDAE